VGKLVGQPVGQQLRSAGTARSGGETVTGIGPAMRSARQERGWSQARLAELLVKSRRVINSTAQWLDQARITVLCC